jgi:hypothetical protein
MKTEADNFQLPPMTGTEFTQPGQNPKATNIEVYAQSLAQQHRAALNTTRPSPQGMQSPRSVPTIPFGLMQNAQRNDSMMMNDAMDAGNQRMRDSVINSFIPHPIPQPKETPK